MSDNEQLGIDRVAEVLEGAQFSDGLSITLQGPEGAFAGSPVVVKLFLAGDVADGVIAELSGIAMALQAVADAIRESK
jgi:hypothetical protein